MPHNSRHSVAAVGWQFFRLLSPRTFARVVQFALRVCVCVEFQMVGARCPPRVCCHGASSFFATAPLTACVMLWRWRVRAQVCGSERYERGLR